tara:strand:+ start:4221 stop:4991 length:771 start_codon:yes stop_codon:yes gene_type:complete
MHNVQNLLADTGVSYYWIGFLLADGSFCKSRMKLSLSIKDKNHLLSLMEYINLNRDPLLHVTILNGKEYPGCSFSVKHPDVLLIQNKFGIPSKKTYNSCCLPRHLKDDLFVSLIIGFIDGDGSIGFQYGRKDCLLRVKVHKSWLPVLNRMAKKVYKLSNTNGVKPHINNSGYAEWSISNHIILKWLKFQAISMKLPVLNRKWGKINEKWQSRQEVSSQRRIEAKRMIDMGFRNTDIANKLGIGCPAVTLMRQRYEF